MRSICNQCGRTGLGADPKESESNISHKDSCPRISKPTTTVKAETKIEKPKVKKSKKSSSSEE